MRHNDQLISFQYFFLPFPFLWIILFRQSDDSILSKYNFVSENL